MRKKIIDQPQDRITAYEEEWLDIQQLAQAEVSSEDAAYPLEEAFDRNSRSCWRASEAGRQVIRIIFDDPQRIKGIHILFEEQQQTRTQEFALRWAAGGGDSLLELVRQQYTFSPGSATQEQEHYAVHLNEVKMLELTIIPDISGGTTRASLAKLWLT